MGPLDSHGFLIASVAGSLVRRHAPECGSLAQSSGDQNMDPYSEMLATMKLKGALYFRAEFTAPWFINAPPSSQLARVLGLGTTHVINFHLLTDGEATIRLRSGEGLGLTAGDIVIFPHGDAHHMMSIDGTCQVEDSAVIEKVQARDLSPLRAGGGGANARFVCGYMACDPFFCRSILDGLPNVLSVSIRTGPSGQWLEHSILHLLDEAGIGAAGSEAMLAKLSEALFIETLRTYAATLPDTHTGWLAAARDHHVGKALALMHNRIAQPWTIADLANEVGLSRTALVDRFTLLLAMPPIQYLTRWRMQLAARALVTTSYSTAQIAADVGYESEAAFNRAFKREMGLPPARFRRETRRDQLPSNVGPS